MEKHNNQPEIDWENLMGMIFGNNDDEQPNGWIHEFFSDDALNDKKEKQKDTNKKVLCLPKFVEDALICYRGYLLQQMEKQINKLKEKQKELELKAYDIDDEELREIFKLGLIENSKQIEKNDESNAIKNTINEIDEFMGKYSWV